jgi:hypothetical protein
MGIETSSVKVSVATRDVDTLFIVNPLTQQIILVLSHRHGQHATVLDPGKARGAGSADAWVMGTHSEPRGFGSRLAVASGRATAAQNRSLSQALGD